MRSQFPVHMFPKAIYSFKRILSQNWEPAEGKTNYRYNQLSPLQLLAFTIINKVLNVKGWEDPILQQSWEMFLTSALRRTRYFQQNPCKRSAPLDCTSQKQHNPLLCFLFWDLTEEFKKFGKPAMQHKGVVLKLQEMQIQWQQHMRRSNEWHTPCVCPDICVVQCFRETNSRQV